MATYKTNMSIPFWIIKRPQGDYYYYTISLKRRDAINIFEEDDIGSWKRWYGRGFRCVKAKIWEAL